MKQGLRRNALSALKLNFFCSRPRSAKVMPPADGSALRIGHDLGPLQEAARKPWAKVPSQVKLNLPRLRSIANSSWELLGESAACVTAANGPSLRS